MNAISTLISSQNLQKGIGVSSMQLENLNYQETEIVLATQNGKRIGDMDEKEKFILAGRVHNEAYIRLGYKSKAVEEVKAEISVLRLDLSKFLGLTNTEVLLALNSGLDGDFLKGDETVFFNSANFVQWVKRYIEQKKMPALKKHENNRVVAEREMYKEPPSVEQQIKIIEEIIQQHKANLEEDINFDFIFDCSMLYDALEDLGIFWFEQKEKLEIYEFVKEKYKNKTEDELNTLAKHRAWVRYIAKLIMTDVEEEEEKAKAKPTVKLRY